MTVALVLLWCTGILMYVWGTVDIAELDPARVDLRHHAAAIHGGMVWIACMFAGRWAWPHVTTLWDRPRTSTWWLGIFSASLLVVVGASGILLLYAPASVHEWTTTVHWWSGLIVPVTIALHGRGVVRR